MTSTFKILEQRVEIALDKVEALNRRARKLGVEEVAVFVSAAFDVASTDSTDGNPVKVITRYRTLTVQGASPKLAGWAFIASISHVALEDGTTETIVAVAPGQKVEAFLYHAVAPTCDHCHTKRRRSETFVLRHDDGREVRVGRSCLSDFLGGADPRTMIGALAYEAGILSALGDEEGWGGAGGGSRGILSKDEFLSAVWLVVRVHGWRGGTKAREEGGISSSARAMQYISDMRSSYPGIREAAEKEYGAVSLEARQADDAEIELALAWAETLAENAELSDYERNLSVAARMLGVTDRSAGILASLYAAYQRHVGAARRQSDWAAKAAVSQHFGTVGKREVFSLRVVRVNVTEGEFGPTTIINFEDAAGNAAVWFASGYRVEEWKVGELYSVKATVKKHDEFRGLAQTVLTRAANQTPAVNPS